MHLLSNNKNQNKAYKQSCKNERDPKCQTSGPCQ
uniref:Uncharacterized protein n=1 Tax=Rhizophora mucronata TaxID=61149 RepID=A0A2P2PSL3_RHIMU